MKTTIVAFPGRYDRQDWLIAVGIILLVFMFGLGYLTTGLPWGDDNAAYITEGIAIANGELAEQAQRNTILHPTELPLETDQNGLVYVWGLPLLLSLVYKLVGFDTVRYSSVIYYKAPPLICLALLGGVLYLFNRRHCSRRCAVFLSLMLCLSNHLLYNMDAIYVDTFFLFFAMLSLLLTEIFVQSLSKPDDCGPSIPLCLALGIVLWYTYETRLNGIAICIVSFCACVIALFRKSKNIYKFTPPRFFKVILPYLILFFLCFVFDHFIFFPATTNMSDLNRVTVGSILRNITYYVMQTGSFLHTLTPFIPFRAEYFLCNFFVVGILCIVCAVGFFRVGFRHDYLHLTLLFIGTYVMLILLPYVDGIRYLFCAFPIMHLYLYEGAKWIFALIQRSSKFRLRMIHALMAALLLCAMLTVGIHDWQNISAGRERIGGAHSSEAVAVYRFIQNNTPKSAIFASVKPRSLFLNTNRMGFRPKVNQHDPLTADYWLLKSEEENALFDLEENLPKLELEFQAGDIRLYKVID